MSFNEKEAIQHGLVKYIGDMARASDKMTLALYHILPVAGHCQFRLHEVYTRYSSDPKTEVWGQKFDVADKIEYDKFPLKHKDSMHAYMNELETYWHCFIVGWIGDHGEPPLTIDWNPAQSLITVAFSKAFPHKGFIKQFWSVVPFEDTDDDDYDWEEDTGKKIERKQKICDFVWNIIAQY